MFCLWMAFIVGQFMWHINNSSKNNDGDYTYLHFTWKSTTGLCLRAFFPRFTVSPFLRKKTALSITERNAHTESQISLFSAAELLTVWNDFSISPGMKSVLFTYLPEYWALHLLGDLWIWKSSSCSQMGSAVLPLKLGLVGPDSIALAPGLCSSLCLPGPTDVAAKTHPSWLEWQHPQASAQWALASRVKRHIKGKNQAE